MIKLMITLLFIALVQISPAQSRRHTSPDGTKYKLVFNDNFNKKKLNKHKWVYRTDSKLSSTQLPENITFGNGNLYLNVKKEKANGKDYTGAGLISRKAFGQGYYEARFKIPQGSGWHTSFWLMYHDGTGGTGPSKTALEYDICENDSHNKNGYNMTLHKWKGQHKTYGSKHLTTPDLSAGFHVWGCEILPDKVHYYFDGTLVQTINTSNLPFGDVNIWLTSIAAAWGNPKAIDDTKLPSYAVFDYVRYYKRMD